MFGREHVFEREHRHRCRDYRGPEEVSIDESFFLITPVHRT